MKSFSYMQFNGVVNPTETYSGFILVTGQLGLHHHMIKSLLHKTEGKRQNWYCCIMTNKLQYYM